jgi:beta-glucosidase
MENRKLIVGLLLGCWIGAAVYADTVAAGATDDSMVIGNKPSENFGGYNTMYLRHENASWGNNYPLVKFDLSSVPSDAVVRSVRLRLFVSLAGEAWPAGFCPVTLFQNTEDWNESSVTFGNAPAYRAEGVETLNHFGMEALPIFFTGTNTIRSGGWLEFAGVDTAALVQRWISGAAENYGVSIQGAGGYLPDGRLFKLSASDSPAEATRPQLIIEYESSPGDGGRVVEPSYLQQAFSANRPGGFGEVAVSSTASGSDASYAMDGDLATVWTSDTNEAAWIAIRLNEPVEVESVLMSWTAATPEEGEIQVSSDGTEWQTAGAFRNGFPGMALLVPCDPVVEARHVRVVCLKRYKKNWNGGDQYCLREWSVNPTMDPFMAEYKEPVERSYSDKTAAKRADQMLSRMSLDQKLDYLVGSPRGLSTKAFPEIGLPTLKMTDASMGLKLPPNTAFPSSILLAASWNVELAALQGQTIGEEARHNGIHILLGPGLNIYRDAENGRNYEYLGEDPFLAGKMAVPYIRALQNEGIIATAKHFVANNIETGKTTLNVEVEERALREIYFPAFKAAVQDGGAMAVMTAYNMLNGQYCAENPWLIKDVLEKEWGFNGLVVSDWLSTYDPVMCFNAGLCLEMPHERALDKPILRALLERDVISRRELDDKVRSILYTGYRMGSFDRPEGDSSFSAGTQEHTDRAEKIAEEGIVLLKNRNNLLPLSAPSIKKIILAGPMVDELPPSGIGSGEVQYAKGFSLVSIRQAFESVLGAGRLTVCATAEAFAALSRDELASADAVVACVGFNQTGFGATVPEGECEDRPFSLNPEQNNLIRQCLEANPRTIVSVTAGGGIDMTAWHEGVAAILYTWYTGVAGGTPLERTIFGAVNPSGKLPISIECSRTDSPAAVPAVRNAGHFISGWELMDLPCDEGVLVGYRYYDTKEIPVRYPFGYGLSYTTFGYSGLGVDVCGQDNRMDVAVSVVVKNTGERRGKEVVQVYVHDVESTVMRPRRELKGFAKVDLAPGESRTLTLHLDRSAFMYFHPDQKQWVLEPGKFEIQVGSSSRDILLKKTIQL